MALGRLSDASALPAEPLITTVTLAELSVGPLVASDEHERAARQAHLQQAEADFNPLPFDADFNPLPFDAAAARAFGRVATSLRRAGRKTTATRERRDDRRDSGRERSPRLYLQPRGLHRNRRPRSDLCAPSPRNLSLYRCPRRGRSAAAGPRVREDAGVVRGGGRALAHRREGALLLARRRRDHRASLEDELLDQRSQLRGEDLAELAGQQPGRQETGRKRDGSGDRVGDRRRREQRGDAVAALAALEDRQALSEPAEGPRGV